MLRGCLNGCRLNFMGALLGICVLVVPAWSQEHEPAGPTVITFNEAFRRAQQNEPAFAGAKALQETAVIDRYLARVALLPTATYHNQMLYTQPNGQTNQGGQAGTQATPIFIGNNTVHEYVSQAAINETLSWKQFANAQAATANAARAAAELEKSRRGLISTVVSLYYAVAASETKRQLLADALRESQSFTNLTQKRESAREVAHADVVKAQLQQQQKQRDASDAQLASHKARLELGVLIFSDPRTPYVTETPSAPPTLLTHDELIQLASENNPEVRSAFALVRASNAEVSSARAAYLPELSLNFSYGIDAPQFAKNGPDGVHNLGYSISGTLDLPVWDWFSTQKRVKQREIRRDAAKVSLTAAQRRMIATLEETYAEAATAREQLDLLEQSVLTAAESLRLTKLRYSAGEATALEVVDAQNSYVTAGSAQADGILRYQISLAVLKTLAGSL